MPRHDYIRIEREDLEGWLDSQTWPWSRTEGTEGVYLIHFSDQVACKLSSSVGRDDKVVGKGYGSMNLSLISRVNGRCINVKARDRKHFQRTKGWQRTWRDGLEHWFGIYNQCADFYDRIALEERSSRTHTRTRQPVSTGTVNNHELTQLRAVYTAARNRGNQWAMGFAKDVGLQVKAGRRMSSRQKTKFEELYREFSLRC